MIIRRLLPFLFLLPSTLSGQSDPRPNILFILADDVGQEVLGCYGGETYHTPHLDELARTGMQFRHSYSMPTCYPSRLTLMTGKYPLRQSQVIWGDFPKEEEPHTFANLLQSNGYATGVAGKWQLTLLKDDPQHPQRMGFQHSDLFGWHEGPRYHDPMIYHNGEVREDTQGYYGPDLYIRSLIDFMSQNRDRPFLAYHSMALCHAVTDDLERPVPHGPFGRYDNYAEMVSEMDRAVGRLVAALNALGLRERTLILFATDNGTPQSMTVRAEGNQLINESFVSRQNGMIVPGGKATLTNGGTRVPMIANWTGTIRPGQDVDDLVDLSDFLPTFLDLANISLPAERNLDGSSFAPLLLDKGRSARSWVYAEGSVLPKPGGVEPSGPDPKSKWVRNAAWKLYNNGRLFNMETDPQEKEPILPEDDSKQSREIRGRLNETLINEF